MEGARRRDGADSYMRPGLRLLPALPLCAAVQTGRQLHFLRDRQAFSPSEIPYVFRDVLKYYRQIGLTPRRAAGIAGPGGSLYGSKNESLYRLLMAIEGANRGWRLRNEHLLANGRFFPLHVANDFVGFRHHGFAFGRLAFVLLGLGKIRFDLKVAAYHHL
jgi:hypothetical protein